MTTNRVLVPLAMLGLIGLGSLILQRWVAETFLAALVLSLVWALLVGIVFLAHAWRHRSLLVPTVAALAIGALAGGGAFWWYSVRDVVVDEDVVTAAAQPQARKDGNGTAPRSKRAEAPVAIAAGAFTGEDGHEGRGTATLIEQPGGDRVLTFTDFDVSPGPDVDVYMTTETSSIEDRVELGDLKGNIGDQQYEVPPTVDLDRYDSVVLYCVSFTVRIAVAPLRS